MNKVSNTEELRYKAARKRVKRVKGFYVHLLVYLAVNVAVIISKIEFHENGRWSFQLQELSLALFWGIGLLSHGLSVFMPSFILGKNWEERKIAKLMEKDNNNTKWE